TATPNKATNSISFFPGIFFRTDKYACSKPKNDASKEAKKEKITLVVIKFQPLGTEKRSNVKVLLTPMILKNPPKTNMTNKILINKNIKILKTNINTQKTLINT